MKVGLFDTLDIRGTYFRNRIWVSPMCQYSSTDGMPNNWHLVHLGKYAVGGAGLVMTEATAVNPVGRISPFDTGLWNDAQAERWAEIAGFIRSQGAAVGIQLSHAGRKASTSPPWEGTKYVPEEEGGWTTVGPSPTAFGELPNPNPLSAEQTTEVVQDFVRAAHLADEAGFDVIEIHAAHGYLIHQYLSPLANHRQDSYGGDFVNRTRLLLEIAEGIRRVWPDRKPLFVRVSATDWFPGGWDIEQTIELARTLAPRGVDLIDCSSGGMVLGVKIPVAPSYQVPFATRIKREASILTAAVGLITDPAQADEIVARGQADAVMMAREMLRAPHWPLAAASELGATIEWPIQYQRAR